jgi:hypothetical protein
VNVVLWAVTGLLVVVFLAAGLMKVSQPREKLQKNLPWVADYSDGQVKGIGAVETLGALGLVLPAIGGFAPWLVPVAAVGLAIAMLLAALMHVRREDGASAAIVPIVLIVLSLFVAWGRLGPYPL